MTISYILFFLFTLITFISILGFGKIFLFFFKLNNNNLVAQYRTVEFILGLILLGFLGILINLYFNLSDIISVCLLILGAIFFIFFSLRLKLEYNKAELVIVLSIILLSTFFSFYSLSNDDFDYHFRMITNFKEFSLFDIEHGRRTSYNSHWIFINAILYITKYPSSVFCITSLLYTLTLFDFYQSFRRNYQNNHYLPTTYSFLVLFFLIGIMNEYKNFGTDFPGQIILLFIFLIFFERFKSIINNIDNTTFFLLSVLAIFAFTIKLINALIFLLLLILFFHLKRKIYILLISVIITLPAILWLFQNYIISKCLIWPIAITCFDNAHNAIHEMLIIESFAKSVLGMGYSMDELEIIVKNFNWLPIWLQNHLPKLLETYVVYIILLIIPVIIFQFKKVSHKNINLNATTAKVLNINFHNPYYIFSFVSILSTLLWLIKAPGYRFGISYNLNFIIIFLLPFWHNILIKDKIFFKNSIKILLIIATLVFLYNNFSKSQQYVERHGLKWPNIVNGKYIYKKGLIL